MRETRTVITITCDRPRCARVISEAPEEDSPSVEKEPDFVLERAGKPAIKYPDLCDICTKAVDNYVLGIEKKPRKKEEPAATVEPDVPRFAMGVWIQGEGDDCRSYSHKADGVGELVTTIPALEDVTDPAEAGALIAAYEEAPPTGGEESGR